MALWTDIIFAWIALTLGFLLIVIWILRLISKKKKIPIILTINGALRRYHKQIGFLLIATALTHGLLSSDKLLSLNWGTANFVVSILLGLSFYLRKKLNLNKWWMNIHRVLTLAFTAIVVIHVISVGGFILDDLIAGRIKPPTPIDETEFIAAEPTDDLVITAPLSPTSTPSQSQPSPSPSAAQSTSPTTDQSATPPTPHPEPTAPSTYIDGVYQATAKGFRSGLVVEVVIENDLIVSVTVISHNEVNKSFWGVPVRVMPKRIIEAQSTDVHTVSGATRTSRGIIKAVNDALAQALRYRGSQNDIS